MRAQNYFRTRARFTISGVVRSGSKQSAAGDVCVAGDRELDSSTAARYLGVSLTTLYEYCSDDVLPFRDVSRPKSKRRTFRFLLRHLEVLRKKQMHGALACILLALSTALGGSTAAFSPIEPPPIVDTDGDGVPDTLTPASIRRSSLA